MSTPKVFKLLFCPNNHAGRKKVSLPPGTSAVFNLLIAACICFLISCDVPQDSIIRYTFRVTAAYDHDPGAYTQGLQYVDGFLYESTGRYGQSTLREVALESGNILRMLSLDEKYFGEGLTVFQKKVYQLTWKAGICFVYDMKTFELLREFSYDTEGWGLTHDGTHLIMSDGSNTLYFRDPDTLQVVRELSVTLHGVPLPMLNELEYIRGTIYANLWQTDSIALIDPESGAVEGLVDASGLLKSHADTDGADVLNGIAYDQDNDRLFVTGKLWPKLFEIELVEQAEGKAIRLSER